ncbi:cyclopropane fatty acyl phospholipid synthase [bacterium]|nr:MAG: cyclopropane fatty acyl phospholipid synthase [bacterium]
MKSYHATASELLQLADISIDGKRPQDIVINDNRLYKRVIRDGELGLGEAYMDGWWDAKAPDEFIAKLLEADLADNAKITPDLVMKVAGAKLFNEQTIKRSSKDVSSHYDIGNDLYEKMLDKRMIYTCAYWKDAKTLDQAQEAKLDLICRKLGLKKGMTLLDIGCGWGGFAAYAAEKYGAKVTGITLSVEQAELAKQNTKKYNCTILLKDYRDMTGSFDRVVSIGMLEHVGVKNYKPFFDKCNELLAKDGIMLHHTIGEMYPYKASGARWVRKYIFPGTHLPTLADINRATEYSLVIEDVHNIGPDYDKTLMAWHKNFVKAYPNLDHDVYDERFFRMWEYYLLLCAGLFRSRRLQLWQIVFRRMDRNDTYKAVR